MAVPRDPAAPLEAEPALSTDADTAPAPTTSLLRSAAGDPRPGVRLRSLASDTARLADEAAASWDGTRGQATRQAVIVLSVGVVCLWGARFGPSLRPDGLTRLAQMCIWSGWQIACFGLVPLLVWLVVLRRPVSEMGLRRPGGARHAWPYAALFGVALPVVLIASTTAAFQIAYPLLEVAPGDDPWPGLWLWWAFYFAQFFAVEAFFRGFLLFGLLPRIGALAVVVPVLPYTMIHFVKPPAEALAAIVGGVVMGTLALRNRSIWWGVALHISVGVVMDLSSLWQKGVIW